MSTSMPEPGQDVEPGAGDDWPCSWDFTSVATDDDLPPSAQHHRVSIDPAALRALDRGAGQ
ncbi:hypothetical protein [Pseudofrankia inefficax]|uniref:Uncharacterized protein n=1 Tax=Pseudofrankia inefficax (strain DSM 45817 / CECT 9037 / DDB 130130 / EuI1c) TaxID=298654 RepID=E3J739_PSEI1|nr:hypothetical protein [Pseudofrankia inefficax]ADP84403.1 hypothetical protein FraEuI1c_6422 [Pseudofrankia inefficax]